MSQAVLCEQKENTAIITINKPKANQLSNEVFEEMQAALDKCEEQAGLRSLIITAAGEKIFCGGADLSSGFGNHTPMEFIKRGQDMNNRIESFPVPVIAAMNGHAFGGGLELAMACHFRILNQESRIGLTETNLGIMPGYGGTLRLPRYVGRARALQMMIFGEQIDAPEALNCGLVNQICEPDKVMQEAMQLAEKIAKRPPLAVKGILGLMSRSPDLSVSEHLEQEREQLVKLFESKDMMEGMTAFMQKRDPEFTGQ
ncbi:MAG: enoyl-CoA hydratase/isomerase family protein [Thermodesulfobacteriota bacterium]